MRSCYIRSAGDDVFQIQHQILSVSVQPADLLPTEVGESSPALPSEQSEHIISLPLREAREHFEREYLVAQIGRFGGNISRTAAFIGMERSALHRKLKSLGVNPNQRRVETNP